MTASDDALPFAPPDLLHGHAISLIDRHQVPELLKACSELEITPIEVLVRGSLDKQTLLEAFALGMRYPDLENFGFNWDAFEDAINDLSWLPGSGFAVVFKTHDQAARSDQEDLHMLREILTQAHVNWAASEVPFRTYVVNGSPHH